MFNEKSPWVPFLAAVVFTLIFGIWGVAKFVNYLNFKIGCEGRLKRAADANTVELAKEELSAAIKYAEANNLTKGSTHLLFPTPDLDIGFWYSNLKASESELESVSPEATQLEKTNLLMKLRETLLDSGEKGTSVTCPAGISIYPLNWLYCIWGCISCFLALVFWGCWVIILMD